MKIFRVVFALCIVFVFSAIHPPARARAELPNTGDVAARINKQDAGVKAAIKAKKRKIAEERNAILAAWKRFRDTRRTCDREMIARVKSEIDSEIAGRKAAISALKDEIEGMQEGHESMAPGRGARAEEGK